jgi:hypothetical protein
MIWNLYLAAVLFSPIEFPVTAQTFNCQLIGRQLQLKRGR